MLPRHRNSSNRVLWLVFAPSRQGGAEKAINLPKWSICQKFCSAGFKAAAAFWRRALTMTGAVVGPAGPSDGILPRLAFCFGCGSRLGLVGGQVGSESATRPFGRGDSNTEVKRQLGALTRRTRPDWLPRHRDSSNRVLWLVFAPSRQGGAGTVRNFPNIWSICPKCC